MDSLSINYLLENLKNPDAIVREQATRRIWRLWFQQKGIYGLEKIDYSQKLIDVGELATAEEVLTSLIQAQPDFAEAWNRRAFLYYSIGNYQKSLTDCQMVVQLNPVHFGALHGMGLCWAVLGKYAEAIQAFQKALVIQPYSLVNQRLILECTLKLS
ncbi:tetratricopeptide repeat protein [Anabaena azotica]|uniref:tetratricopeptide repeat protein n=1 Tax=Anabaena azotica TaxID=197653 RepID=UPI0039A64D06